MPARKKVALYCRVSTLDKQDPAMQLDELRQVAGQRGWDIAGEYIDHGISGAATSRPALDRLLADAQAGVFGVVLVWKLDRLGRSLRHLLEVLGSLDSWGTSFASVRDPGIDTTTPSGRLMTMLLGAFAEFEREMIRERVVAGVRRAQAQGKHCGRPRVEVDLRPAVAMLEQGYGLKAISRALSINRATLRRRLEEAGQWPRRAQVTSEGTEVGASPRSGSACAP